MIGLSVSLCCEDMAQGKIDPVSVEKIVSRTACSNEEDWLLTLDSYRRFRWDKVYADDAVRIANEFWKAGKIEQPRLTNGKMPDINATGVWVNSEDEIVFVPYRS